MCGEVVSCVVAEVALGSVMNGVELNPVRAAG